jgi:hypothetical protein
VRSSTRGTQEDDAYIAPSWSWASLPSATIHMISNHEYESGYVFNATIDHERTFVLLTSENKAGAISGGQLCVRAPLPTLIIDTPSAVRHDSINCYEVDLTDPGGWATLYFDEYDVQVGLYIKCVFFYANHGEYRGLIVQPAEREPRKFRRIGVVTLRVPDRKLNYGDSNSWEMVVII